MNKGVVFSVLSAFAFSIQNVIVKTLSVNIGTGEIVFFRGFITAIFIFLLMRARHIQFSHCDRPELIFRGLAGAVGLCCNFYALKKLPLADVSILAQSTGFFVIIFAFIFLHERLKLGALVPLVIIVFGVSLVIRPWDLASFNRYSLLMLVYGICCAAVYTTISRLTRTGRHHEYEIVIYFMIASAITGFMLMLDNFTWPGRFEGSVLLCLGLVTVVAQTLMTLGYKYGDPVIVTFAAYVAVIFDMTFGYVLFDETVGILSLFGGVLIIGGTMYLTRLKENNGIC